MQHKKSQYLTNEVKKKAHSLGFSIVGVTSPEPPPHLDVFSSWLENDYHADMAWLASDRSRLRRSNPLEILPECKSILVLGIQYPQPQITGAGSSGKIASYAWGNDYHDILEPKLIALTEYLESLTGRSIPNRRYTDTGPILEREFAQRAGLGWIGKNTCLINREVGSYILLAEILLGIELEFDIPVIKDFCGTCMRCIDNCPTNCILNSRVIDSNRCISYLTIEHKGFIPKDLRPLIGTWIFGCDQCQIICPWNQKTGNAAGQSGELSKIDQVFSARSGVPPEDLVGELGLTQEAFNLKFKGSPVHRTKRRRYLRNVSIALGNLGERRAIPSLVNALRDHEPLIRGHAAWALGQIGGEQARDGLFEAGQVEGVIEVRSEIYSAFECIKQ